MTVLVLALIFLVTSAGSAESLALSPAGEAGAATSISQPQELSQSQKLIASLTKYYVGVLRKGPKWSTESPAALEDAMLKRQEALRSLAKQGKIVGTARMVDVKEVWALIFFKTDNETEVRELAANAKLIQEGVLDFAAYKVWGTKGLGAGLGKESGRDTLYLVVAVKGDKWSGKTDETTRSMMDSQTDYLVKLHTSGALRFSCTMESDVEFARGLLIVAAASEGDAYRMISSSPMVKAKWLEPSVYRVIVPHGTLP